MSKLKFGLLGLGRMGENYVKILSGLPSVQWLYIYDADENRKNEIKAKYNIDPKRVCQNVDELIEQSEAICLVTSTPTHYELAKKILAAKKPLLVEKPMAATSEQAAELVELAEKNKVALAVGHIERFNPAFAALYEYSQKLLPLSVSTWRESPYPARMSDVSIVYDMLIHDIDIVYCLAKAAPNRIEARGKKEKGDYLDEVSARIFFENGFLADLSSSRLKDDKKRLASVSFEEFNLEADLLNRKLYKKTFADPSSGNAFNVEELPIEQYDQLTAQLKNFIKAIRQGIQPKVTGEEALQILKITEEIEKRAQ